MSNPCGHCGKPLGDSVSPYFCGELCARYWAGERVGIEPPKPYVPPAGASPFLLATWGMTPTPIVTQAEAQEVAERILAQSRATNASVDIAPAPESEAA